MHTSNESKLFIRAFTQMRLERPQAYPHELLEAVRSLVAQWVADKKIAP